MAAMTMQAATMTMPTPVTRRVLSRPAFGAVALAVSTLLLLVVMLPGLARVSGSDEAPRAMAAPSMMSVPASFQTASPVVNAAHTGATAGPHPADRP